MKTSRILAIHVVVTLIHNFNCEPVVEIGESQIFGKTVDYLKSKVNQYLSIPYAQPPVGELRFQPTVPIGQLPRKLNAFDEPPACPQYTDRPFPWYVNSSKKSEDCLYLNIWTPPGASPKKKKAVMYWVHGGGYRYGSMRTELYNGTFLSALGDIIVVTVNYRVGPFGFLASGTNDAPGNAGKL
ncbi:acetylcholinesterase [Nephila pilipes]|uniref:Acetylcholinesterase n=1 Tax=Nephila pilipes TaxID=299642 RepID=A0A8X6UK06_NEPPI|nr:acetylcholinesterase [Nephila pilipes]